MSGDVSVFLELPPLPQGPRTGRTGAKPAGAHTPDGAGGYALRPRLPQHLPCNRPRGGRKERKNSPRFLRLLPRSTRTGFGTGLAWAGGESREKPT